MSCSPACAVAHFLLNLVLLVLTLGPCSSSGTTTYCVQPDSEFEINTLSTSDGNTSCHPLSYYVDNSSRYFTSNTELVFLPGVFTLHDVISVSLVDTLSLVGSGRGDSASLVQCSHSTPAGIAITNSSNIAIHSLAFLQCSHSAVSIENNNHTALAFVNVTNLTVSGATVNESVGIGLFIYEVFGSSSISNSLFASNSPFSANGSCNRYISSGNAFVILKECPMDTSPTQFLIDSSSFLYGVGTVSKSPGLYMEIETYACTTVHVILENSIFNGNVNNGNEGGNIAIELLCYTGFENTLIELRGNTIANGSANHGGGLYMAIFSVDLPITLQSQANACSYMLVVNDSCFVGNHAVVEGGGLSISNSYKVVFGAAIKGKTHINNCTFSKNTVDSGGYGEAVIVDGFLNFQKQKVSSFEVTFDDCVFENNHQTPHTDAKLSYPATGAVFVLEAQDGVEFSDCIFRGNNNTALLVARSNVIFRGSIIFLGNSGYDGGGINFCSRSYVYFGNKTIVTFQNNTAQNSGGGIYVASQCPELKPGCFYQFVVNVTEMIATNSVQVIMNDNRANYAGSAIYGGDVEQCYVFVQGYNGPDIFPKVFQVPNITADNLSPVSSMPIRVCLCSSSSGICSDNHFQCSVYPGETISVLAVAVGQGGGVVPGIVIASPRDAIQGGQYAQKVQRSCKNLAYTLHSNGSTGTNVTLNIEKPDLYEGGHSHSAPVIQALFKSCPLGFTLKHSPKVCDCMDVLTTVSQNVKCHFQRGTPVILRSQGTTWIGDSSHSHHWRLNVSQAILISSNCLQHTYCTDHSVQLEVNDSRITNQNSQCTSHRNGILCGSCSDGYGVTSDFYCVKCIDNIFGELAYIVFFFTVGLSIVLILFWWGYSITDGKFNGLIFYANILQNQALFFHIGPKPERMNTWLQVFIGVMNLKYNWGCLYDGMDVYARVWVEYVFPLYLFLVTAAIIFASRWSIRISRLVIARAPNNIATLLLMMYVNLIQTAIYGLSWAIICYQFRDGRTSTIKVWLYDGNIEYLRGRHIYLFAFSVIVIALSFPYTLSLLLIQPLRSYSHLRPLRWVQRLKPLFDAYTGPYKTRYHFWPGLLLLARNLLLVVFAMNNGGDPKVSLGCVVLVCSILQAVAWGLGGVYRRQALDALESFFFFNLIFLSIIMIYAINNKQSGLIQIAVDTSVGVSFLIALGLSAYSFYKHTRQRFQRGLVNCYRRCTQIRENFQVWRNDFRNNQQNNAFARHPLPTQQLPASQQLPQPNVSTVRRVAGRDEMTECSLLLPHDPVTSS